MAKTKAPLTREDLKETARKTLIEIPTTTRVKAWTFQTMKQNYVVISYRNMIDIVDVYSSTRAGRKLSTTPLISHKNSSDVTRAFEEAVEMLIPAEETPAQ